MTPKPLAPEALHTHFDLTKCERVRDPMVDQ
jgi:hypothetical protein